MALRTTPALACILLIGAGGCAAKAPASPPRAVAPPFDPRAAELLEGPERDRWQRPAELVRRLGIRPGSAVADIGSGTGYLLPHLSRAVGPRGAVYAEEIQEAFLGPLERRRQKLGNVEVILGAPEDPRLPPRSVDLFVLLTVYHEVRRPVPFLRKLHGAARPGARLAIIDFDPDRKGDPPPPKEHSVREAVVLDEAARAGWRLKERVELTPSQFFLIFEQPVPVE